MSTKWGFFHRLRPDQIEDIKAETSVAYVPWGALEWHSYHNPVGLDGMIAEDVCAAIAESVGGLVLPPVYVGTDTIKVGIPFPHTVEHAQSTVDTLCREYCAQLSLEGFKVVVVLTGHCGAGHRDALGAAVDASTKAFPDTRFLLIPAFDPVQDTWAVNHAAEGETSLQMAVDASNVDLNRLPQNRVATLKDDGVWGDDPSVATQEKGKAIRSLMVERCSLLVNDLLEAGA